MTTPLAWPAVLQPLNFGYSLVEPDITGGRALGGGEQWIASVGPRWEATMELNVWSKEQVLALRALRVQSIGRVVPVKLPNFDGQRLSWTVGGGTTATVNGVADAGATTINIQLTPSGTLLPGQQFGVGDYLYEIGTASLAGGIWTVTFLPPLRADATAGETVLFETPYNLMRVMNLADEFRRLELMRFTVLNLEFSEFL